MTFAAAAAAASVFARRFAGREANAS
ncbi:hypothetical protein NKG05_15905 [Oerskovia sp. M15]